jgi:hypothetical protein
LPVCHNFPHFATSYDWIQLEISVKIVNCHWLYDWILKVWEKKQNNQQAS